MAISTIKNKAHLLILTGSGSTNAQGAVLLPDVDRTKDSVLWVHTTSDVNALCIPFKYGNADGYWYAKIVNWTNFAIIGSKVFNLEICVLRKS